MKSKQDLRQLFRQSLEAWQKSREKNFEDIQKSFSQNLVEFLKNKKGFWCAYQALPDEPVLSEVFKASAHLKWVFPLVRGQDLQFYQPQDFLSFQKGSFGILEPKPENSRPISIDEIDGFLVPGRAFDFLGTRLGRGKSFYDRALKNYTGAKVGLCFSPQVSQEPLLMDSWDVRMDFVITEERVIQSSQQGE